MEEEDTIDSHLLVKILINVIWHNNMDLLFDNPEFRDHKQNILDIVQKHNSSEGSKDNPIVID